MLVQCTAHKGMTRCLPPRWVVGVIRVGDGCDGDGAATKGAAEDTGWELPQVLASMATEVLLTLVALGVSHKAQHPSHCCCDVSATRMARTLRPCQANSS